MATLGAFSHQIPTETLCLSEDSSSRIKKGIAYTRFNRNMTAHLSDRARRSPGRQDWKAEYAELSARDRRTALGPADLERLGLAAYLAGDESGSIDAHTRAHNIALENRDSRQAARSAFWIAFALIGTRELTRAAG